MQELSIPKLRVAVLIGTKGTTKKKIESATRTKITISKEGDVIIEGESLDCFVTEKVVRAIGRGFNPDVALQLKNEDYVLEVLKITDYVGKSLKKFVRIKARLIGTKGKARKVIEKLTKTSIVIYGKTVSIIGKYEDVIDAKEAVKYLLEGAPHGNVYNFLEGAVSKRK
jgi:ribosomal RNA assembly protein